MKGHILLYTGHVDGVPYAVHALWGYRERTWGGDRVRVTGRVVLSDLTLGKGTKKGPFSKGLFQSGCYRLSTRRFCNPVTSRGGKAGGGLKILLLFRRVWFIGFSGEAVI